MDNLVNPLTLGKTSYIRKSTTFILGDGQKDAHTPKGVSETIPDMALSLRDILERHTRGLEVPQFKPVYNDEEIPDLQRMDIVDRMELLDAVKRDVATMRQQRAQFTEQKQPQPKATNIPAPTPEQFEANKGDSNN